MVALAVDPFNQLLAGLRAALVAATDLPADAVLSDWPDPEMVARLGTLAPDFPHAQQPVLLISSVGPSAPVRPQPVPSTSSRTLFGPTDPIDASRVVQYSEVQRLQTALQITVLAAGLRGKTLAGQSAARIVSAFGPGLRPDGTPRSRLPLPDDGEAPATVPGLLGFSAQLLYAGERSDDRYDARQIYGHILLYTVIHSRYTLSTEALTTGVGLGLLSVVSSQ